ncbi:MAG: NAD(P)-dependent oxidoreductase [bacterium]
MTPHTALPHVAFLGLGIMGSGMASRLLAAGYPVTVYNRNPDKARPLRDAGASVGTSPRDAASSADVVITMVADDDASRAMWEGESGALAGARRGTLLVECSTVTAARIADLAADADRVGCTLIDAPVTGSKNQAAAGELTFLVGGSDVALERIRPALTAMGTTIHHLGPTGSGALVKLINNFLCGVQAASLAEAIAVIEHSSLDRGRAVDAIISGSPGSPVMKTLAARMTMPDFTPNFYLHLLVKDMRYAIAEGESRGVPMRTAETALGLLEGAMAHGDGDRDMAAVVEQFRAVR